MTKLKLFFLCWLSSLCLNTQAAESLSEDYEGVPLYDEQHRLVYVDENSRFTHSKENYVMIHVKNIKSDRYPQGKVKVHVWDNATSFCNRSAPIFRASSHWAYDARDGEMIFKISGLVPGNTYSYFTHFDQNNNGELDFFGVIPTEPYMFTNTANQGQGPGLSREGLGAPRYESTLVTYRQPAQEIILPY